MSLRINNNVSALNAHRNLLANDRRLAKSLERLSSGLRINRAADAPASLVISEQMRAQIAGVDQAIKNSEFSISMVQTAESALNEVSNLLISVRQLAIHAANEGANDAVMLEADQKEIANALSSIDRIAATTQFGTRILLDGSNGANGTATGQGVELVRAGTNTKPSGEEGYPIRIQHVATRAKITGQEPLTEDMVEDGETLTVSEGGRTATYTSTENDTVETTVQNLASAARRAGLDVTITLDDMNKVMIEHNQFGSGFDVQAASTTEGVLSKKSGELILAEPGKDLVGTINNEPTKGSGQVIEGLTGNPDTEGLAIRYTGENEDFFFDEDGDPLTMEEIQKAAEDPDSDLVVYDQEGKVVEEPEKGAPVGFVAVTQNSLTFQVGANPDQTVSVSLPNTSANALAKGVKNSSMFRSLSDIDVQSTQGAQDSLMLIDKAINEVTEIRSELGSFQKNTLESNLSNLRVAHENLVAAESSIRDADMAAEVAEYTRDNILLQSSAAMLAQANQVPGRVLNLLLED